MVYDLSTLHCRDPRSDRVKASNPGIEFIALTYNKREEVRAFLDKRPFDFVQITDAKAFADQWQIGYPTTLFIDKEGIVKDVLIGSSLNGLDEAKFLSSLKKII